MAKKDEQRKDIKRLSVSEQSFISFVQLTHFVPLWSSTRPCCNCG